MSQFENGSPAPQQKPGHGPKPPKAYKIKIDGTMYEVEAQFITGREILALAQKSPSQYDVGYKVHGHDVRIVGLDESVDLATPGLEKFITIQNGHTDGEEGPSGPFPFAFTEEDQSFADRHPGSVERVSEGSVNWVLIHGMDVPDGYNVSKVTAAIMLPVGYPTCGLDMVYFYPELSLTSGKAIHAAEVRQTIQGKSYQRWSRHFTSQAPWRPGIDCLETYYAMIQGWLRREVTR